MIDYIIHIFIHSSSITSLAENLSVSEVIFIEMIMNLDIKEVHAYWSPVLYHGTCLLESCIALWD